LAGRLSLPLQLPPSTSWTEAGKAVQVLDTTSRPISSLTAEELEAIASGEAPRLPITINGDATEALPYGLPYTEHVEP